MLCNMQSGGPIVEKRGGHWFALEQHKMSLVICVWLSDLISSAPVFVFYY